VFVPGSSRSPRGCLRAFAKHLCRLLRVHLASTYPAITAFIIPCRWNCTIIESQSWPLMHKASAGGRRRMPQGAAHNPDREAPPLQCQTPTNPRLTAPSTVSRASGRKAPRCSQTSGSSRCATSFFTSRGTTKIGGMLRRLPTQPRAMRLRSRPKWSAHAWCGCEDGCRLPKSLFATARGR